MSGRYVVTREGEPAGEERFTITSSAGVWRAAGTLELHLPVEQVTRYRLDLSTVTEEPLGFALEIELEGVRQRAVGRREGDLLVVEGETLAGRWTRRVPYGRGTAIELGTPLSSTLVSSLLGPSLAPKQPALVRTVFVTPPTLEPAVQVLAYELFGREGEVSRIAVGPTSGEGRIALWVRPDGLPIRVRTGARGARFELRLAD